MNKNAKNLLLVDLQLNTFEFATSLCFRQRETLDALSIQQLN